MLLSDDWICSDKFLRIMAWAVFFAQGIGTSMLQIPNIMKRPLIWLPPTLASAILGPIAIIGPFHMTNMQLVPEWDLWSGWTDHDLPDYGGNRITGAGNSENCIVPLPTSGTVILCDLPRNAKYGIY